MDYAQKLVDLEAERRAAIAVLTTIEERISKTHFLKDNSTELLAAARTKREKEVLWQPAAAQAVRRCISVMPLSSLETALALGLLQWLVSPS